MGQGGTVAFDVEDGEVRLRKAGKLDVRWAGALEATLRVWDGEDDEQANRDL